MYKTIFFLVADKEKPFEFWIFKNIALSSRSNLKIKKSLIINGRVYACP